MSMRRDGDQVRTIGSYENWLEQSIREAQQRGEFDNLSGQGKPQDLTVDPHAGDWDSGFRILKNNGLAPAWIEADKEIRAEQAALAGLAERTASFIAEHLATAEAPPAQPAQDQASWSSRVRRLWSGRPVAGGDDRHFSLADLRYERDRARREYLRRSEELNQKIHEYNSLLPFDLLWRERRKIDAQQAADAFDSACPPIDE
ncbi:MAG TPA: DnaJ family domain-containing protein [Thermomicrobiales bacterium]|nr:DnaJ family domain-containing protein [Thermomicrobiales bacterium]